MSYLGWPGDYETIYWCHSRQHAAPSHQKYSRIYGPPRHRDQERQRLYAQLPHSVVWYITVLWCSISVIMYIILTPYQNYHLYLFSHRSHVPSLTVITISNMQRRKGVIFVVGGNVAYTYFRWNKSSLPHFQIPWTKSLVTTSTHCEHRLLSILDGIQVGIMD